MPKKKSTILKLHARDRRPLVAKLFLDGEPIPSIADKFQIKTKIIKNDIQHHFQEQNQNIHLDPQEQISIEIASLNRVENAAWDAYTTDASETRFLRIIQDCSKHRILLLKLSEQITLPEPEENHINTVHIIRDQK